jgi:hypothetical protein
MIVFSEVTSAALDFATGPSGHLGTASLNVKKILPMSYLMMLSRQNRMNEIQNLYGGR